MSISTAVVVGVGAERGLGAVLCRHFATESYHGFAIENSMHSSSARPPG
jgi:NAD(P)-dependent dehydrogenase (short-subunit alcohol dehydrogenase family)